jgi:hypothetical protein
MKRAGYQLEIKRESTSIRVSINKYIYKEEGLFLHLLMLI